MAVRPATTRTAPHLTEEVWQALEQEEEAEGSGTWPWRAGVMERAQEIETQT